MSIRFTGHIVIVGPIGVGKTPIATRVAERLKIDVIHLDERQEELEWVGWKQAESMKYINSGDYLRDLKYRAKFAIPFFRLVTELNPTAVIDCGGDDLVTWTETSRKRVNKTLKDLHIQHVAAVLPFREKKRMREWSPPSERDRLLISNPSYGFLAKRRFYTKALIDDAIFDTVAGDIIGWVRG